MYAQIKDDSCLLCHEVITNPVCPQCLQAEMVHWLKERRPELLPELLAFNAEPYFTGTKCIICGSSMNICAHCYSADVFLWLKDISKELAEEFMDCFNFELKEHSHLLG